MVGRDRAAAAAHTPPLSFLSLSVGWSAVCLCVSDITWYSSIGVSAMTIKELLIASILLFFNLAFSLVEADSVPEAARLPI